MGTERGRRNEVLIAAQSGRALAQAAVRAGYVPLVVDLFADDDTRAAAADLREVQALRYDALVPALEQLAAGRRPIGVVLGSGFEDQTPLVASLHERFRVIGNDSIVISYVKDSVAFAAACAATGVPHPAVRLSAPDSADWLRKREGGSGGSHVSRAVPGAACEPGWYFQQRVNGAPAGVQFVADGRGMARVIAVTEQWTDGTPQQPFRFGGSVRPSTIDAALEAQLTEAVMALTQHFGLRGLNNLDVVIDGDDFTALEINPRPGASIDLFPEWPLFAWHVAGSRGVLPAAPAPPGGARALALAYAARDLVFANEFDWPEWTADRTRMGNRIAAGEAYCSVHGEAATAADARALVASRLSEIGKAVETL